MSSAIDDKTIVRISMGMLWTMGTGLIALVMWLGGLSFQSSAQAKRTEEIEKKVNLVSQIHEDIAVTKNEIIHMNEKLDDLKRAVSSRKGE